VQFYPPPISITIVIGQRGERDRTRQTGSIHPLHSFTKSLTHLQNCLPEFLHTNDVEVRFSRCRRRRDLKGWQVRLRVARSPKSKCFARDIKSGYDDRRVVNGWAALGFGWDFVVGSARERGACRCGACIDW